MKFSSTLIFALLLVYSCKNLNQAASQRKISDNSKTIITGTPLDIPKQKLYSLHSHLGYEKISVDSSGFKAKINSESPGIVDVVLGYNTKFPVYYVPGDSIHFSYRESDLENDFNKMKISGDHGLENEVLMELNAILKYEDTNYNPFFNCSEKSFIIKLDSLERIVSKKLENYKENTPKIDTQFLRLAKSYIDYQIAIYLEAYPDKLRRLGKKYAELDDRHTAVNADESNDLIQLGELYLAKKESIKHNNSDNLNNVAFSNYTLKMVANNAYSYFQEEAYDRNGRMSPDLSLYFKSIDSLFTEKEVVDNLKFRTILEELNSPSPDTEMFIETYRASNPADSYLTILDKKFKEKNLVNSGKYLFKDADGNEVSLSQFKGKIIYIDVWATWCGPCIDEKSHFESLIDQFATEKENIAFLEISIDKDEKKWKKMLQNKKLKGVQLNTNKGFKSDLCQDFSIWGIPRFIIIDKNGMVVKSNAQRPSNPEIYFYLKMLLGKEI